MAACFRAYCSGAQPAEDASFEGDLLPPGLKNELIGGQTVVDWNGIAPEGGTIAFTVSVGTGDAGQRDLAGAAGGGGPMATSAKVSAAMLLEP